MPTLSYGSLSPANSSDHSFDQLDELLKQLTEADVRIVRTCYVALLMNDYARIFVARDEADGGRIVGVLVVTLQCALSGWKAYIDSVVVHSDYRRQGILSELNRYAVVFARERNVYRDELTSNNSSARQVAHAAYLKLGFRKRDTTVFRRE